MNQQMQPVDFEHRFSIETGLDATFFVEAGAGTGKTRELVERIANLVIKKSASIERIAAITFTEAAAAELRDRVRAKLEETSLNPAQGELSRSRCLTALSRFDDANIQTLHSFAASLLREKPFEANLPPNFDVMDEMAAGIEFNRKWNEWVDYAMNSKTAAPVLLRAMKLGLKLEDLKKIAMALHDNYDRLPQAFEDIPLPVMMAAKEIAGATSEIEALLPLAWDEEGDPLAEQGRRVVALGRILADTGFGSEGALSLLNRFGKIASNSGNQKGWQDDPVTGINACKLLKDRFKELDEIRSRELEQIRSASLIKLAEELREAVTRWVADRLNAGRLEFHDLLVCARNSLRDLPETRRHFQQRFSHILIDEFQDTDPIQAEIAFYLAADSNTMGEEAVTEKDWQKLRIAPGKLFVVGDPKQSIYRFRRADIATVQLVSSLLSGQEAPLKQNFRSQEKVIAWVNGIFETWMGTGQPGIQADYMPLSAWWDDAGRAPAMGVHWFGNQSGENAEAVRRIETSAVATAIRRIKSEAWLVKIKDTDDMHPVRYADICVLIPTRTILPRLEQALDEAGIPYRVESESFVLGTRDVKELLDCLRAIDSPADRVALVAALRSTAFGISDVELLKFVEQGGRLDYSEPVNATGVVAQALAELADFNRRRIWLSPVQLIESFIRERRLSDLAFARPRPRERLRRLKLVTEQARAFSRTGERSLRTFLDWMDQQLEERARMVEIPVPEEDEDAVRIMTVHAAKGLEFPAVIVCGIGSWPNIRSDSVIFERTGNKVHITTGSDKTRFTTPGYDDAVVSQKEAEAAETVRLMYVAATRARDYLLVSLFRKEKSGSAAETLDRLASESGSCWQELDVETPVAPEPGAKETTPSAKDSPAARQAWIEKRARVIKNAARKSATGVTTITRQEKDEPEAGEVYYRKGRGGTNIGRAVHSTLQSIDLATGTGLEDYARAQAQAEGIPDRWQDVARLTRNALNTPVVRRAIASGRYHREVFASVTLEGIQLEGFVDLMFEEHGSIVIADYKTDAVKSEIEPKMMQKYSLQAAAYALAVSSITGKPVREVVLVFAAANTEKSLKNLEPLFERVRQLAEEAAGVF